MSRSSEETVVCHIVDEHATLTLGELCRSCGVPAEWVARLVEEGVLEPMPGSVSTRWEFSVQYLSRVHRAARLERDLGLNMSGIALTLELMDEIRRLRRRLDAIER